MIRVLSILTVALFLSSLCRAQEPTTTTRVPAGTTPTADSDHPRITPDGRFVAFESDFDFTGAGTGTTRHIYRVDRSTGTTLLLSRADGPAGAIGTADSRLASISDDGDVVAFESFAPLDPLADSGTTRDIYVRFVSANDTVLVTEDSGGTAVGGWHPSISGSGEFVAFTSSASTLVAGDTNGRYDVFVADIFSVPPFHELVSLDNSGMQSTLSNFGTTESATSYGVGDVVSDDGRFVLFVGAPCDWDAGADDCGGAANDINCLCPDIDNNCSPCTSPRKQIYLRDVFAGRTYRISREGDSESGFLPANGNNYRPTLHTDGDSVVVVFQSYAMSFGTGDPSSAMDIFLIEIGPIANIDSLPGPVPVQVSTGIGGNSNGASRSARISRDGQWLIYDSFASNLVAGDTNNARDVFLANVGDQPYVNIRVNTSDSGAQSSGGHSVRPDVADTCGTAAVFGNCDFFYVYSGSATNLIPGDTNGAYDVFLGLSRSFIRGDYDNDGDVDPDDHLALCAFFGGGPAPSCLDAADANDDSSVDISDCIYLGNFLFQQGPPPPWPFPAPFVCGKDPTTDGLSCSDFSGFGCVN